MEEHEDKAMRQHLRMMMSIIMMQLKEPPAAITATTNKQLEYLVNLPPVEFTITEYTKKKECNAEWTSPPFYLHPQGYKFCLMVYPNGYSFPNKFLSVGVGVLFLESDDVRVDWPLQIDFQISFLDWRSDEQDFQKLIEFDSSKNLVTKDGIKRSLIFDDFIPHSSLSYNSTTNTEYLQNMMTVCD